MPWQRIVISKNEESIAEMSAAALVNAIEKAYLDAMLPNGVEAWRSGFGGTEIFYLSPKAAEIAASALTKWKLVPFAERPDLTGFSRLQL